MAISDEDLARRKEISVEQVRQAFRAAQARNDDGRIPPNALGRALEELRAMRAAPAGKPRVAGLPAERTVQPGALIATSLAGLTQDHWEPVDDLMANLAVSCMTMDSKHPEVMYAGTGEGFFNLDAIRGAGIFRTVDGVAWKRLEATATEDFTRVNRLAISKSSTVLLAATGGGLFRSSDKARQAWTKVLDAPIADVKFHPTRSTRAVAGGLTNGEAYYSANGGRTWRVATHGPWSGRVELAYAVANPDVVYASVEATNGEIWRSTDGGRTYQRRATLDGNGDPAPYLGDQGWYDNAIWCGDPTDENLLVVGGIDLWRSNDGGDTLAEISTWWHPRSVHADQH